EVLADERCRENIRGQRVAVEREDVVALGKRVVDQLPVRVEHPCPLVEESPAVECVVAKLRSQPGQLRLNVDWIVPLDPDEDQPETFGGGQWHQSELGAVESLECVARERLPEQVTVQVVCPGVIRALQCAPGTAAPTEHP